MEKNADGIKELTETQKAKIATNLQAYTGHFGEPVIAASVYHKGIYIFRSKKEFVKEFFQDSYVQLCPNIDYVNGWLYGAVQAKTGQVKAIDMYKTTIYGKEIEARNMTELKRKASIIANGYFNPLDKMEVEFSGKSLQYLRFNTKCPNNTIQRGEWH
jgi:hypothetical protein